MLQKIYINLYKKSVKKGEEDSGYQISYDLLASGWGTAVEYDNKLDIAVMRTSKNGNTYVQVFEDIGENLHEIKVKNPDKYSRAIEGTFEHDWIEKVEQKDSTGNCTGYEEVAKHAEYFVKIAYLTEK